MYCKTIYVRKGRAATLTVTLNKETSWDSVTWRFRYSTVRTTQGTTLRTPTYEAEGCSEKGGPQLQHRTQGFKETGVFQYSAKMESKGSEVECSGTVLVYGGFCKGAVLFCAKLINDFQNIWDVFWCLELDQFFVDTCR